MSKSGKTKDKKEITTTSNYLNHKSTYDKLRQKTMSNYYLELENNELYSLEVDPLNEYNMSEDQKTFILMYIQYRSIPMAASMAGIDSQTGKQYMTSYGTRKEIRRINEAMAQRQFATKALTLEQCRNYLTAVIAGTDVPEVDRLKGPDKLKAMDLLIKVDELLDTSISNPNVLINSNVEDELKNLSLSTIERMIEASSEKETNEKSDIIQEINKDHHLSAEEVSMLKTLSTKELLNILNNKDKGGSNNDIK